ncbi:GNAT family N-acetyltransferase [Pedobacter nutrimenti]|uniref:Ribosomal protein S18 acetylase RimI-like enzyme n=1 Tax=Pedobacter nutrimenti TaxID=1241337 RepID=A0A318UHV0_9SPHI|nr:GNAT family N-acetyltransferase [Pedobacter nutrimenti]PYF75882.1 ribosomal protein S18 acetylase RimI-like enzyme [Pedobacter nutrimenti]
MILLRRAKEQDIPAIRAIAQITWGPTYVPLIGQQQVDYMLEKMYNDGVLQEQFLHGYIFLMAEINKKDVGFASYSLADPEQGTYKLHKLYVLPETHGKGVGKFLINEVVNKVREAGGKSLELNVNRENNAKDFYERAGFKIKETVDLDIGNGFFMNDYVMEMKLEA